MKGRLWLGHLLLTVLAFVILAGLYALTHPDPAARAFEPFPNMVHAPSYLAYEPNPVFRDGRTLQAPPEGTMPYREARPETDPAHGRVVFARACAPCHGPAGNGDGPVVRRGFPAPPNLPDPRVAAMTETDVVAVIRNGKGNMPSLAPVVAPEDRSVVARYFLELARREAP